MRKLLMAFIVITSFASIAANTAPTLKYNQEVMKEPPETFGIFREP